MRAVVCGGAGFIGSHLVDRLVRDGHHVVVIDDLSRGKRENLAGAMSTGRCRLVELGLGDARLADCVMDAYPDTVFHLAAQIDVRASVADPVLDAATNVLGTIAVLEAARRAHARKVIMTSSVAIYGKADLPVTETTPTKPLSPYAASKLTGEIYLAQYRNLYGLDYTTVVLTNTYGPRQDPCGESGVVAVFVDAMLAGRPTRIFGDGSNTRDYLYVGDAVDALVRASGQAGSGCRVNVGTGVATSDLTLNWLTAQVAGCVAEPLVAPARPGDIPHMVVDSSLAAELLDWRPRVRLVDGLELTVGWLRNSTRSHPLPLDVPVAG